MLDPVYVEKASKEGRLYLVRTKGSLSGGTRVTLVAFGIRLEASQGMHLVQAPIQVNVKTAPHKKTVMHEVLVTDEDLVIRRMKNHPDVMLGGNGEPTKKIKNRQQRRKEQKVTQAVLEQLKAKVNNGKHGEAQGIS